MPSKPKVEPVPDDDVPERIVADTSRQESGDRPWSGFATSGVLEGPVVLRSAGCVLEV